MTHIIRPHFFCLSIWHRVATVMVVKAGQGGSGHWQSMTGQASSGHWQTWSAAGSLQAIWVPVAGAFQRVLHTGVEIPFLGVFGKKITYRHIYLSICCCLVSQSCPILCHPMDCSLPGSSIHGISQARTLEWVAISFSRGSSWPRDRTCVSCIGMQVLYCWATWEA